MIASVADHCGVGFGIGNLPEEARVRTYTADVRQDGPTLSLTVSGPSIVHDPRVNFPGKVVPGGLELSFPEYDYPHFADRLPSARFLGVFGSVVAVGSGNRFTGRLDGYPAIYESAPSGGLFRGIALALCYSTSHPVVLSR